VKPNAYALIPARGGSKSIPRKNIKLLDGVPLIAYSIAAGLQAQSISRVIVSTDDEEIAAIARKWGGEVPFMRPADLAEDDTPDLPVFQHALRWLKDNEGVTPDVVVHLRPTTPIRPPDCIDEAVRILLDEEQADSVRAVVSSGQNPFKMWRIDPDGQMNPLMSGEFSEPYNMPRQQLPATYWQTGHVDAARYETIMAKDSMTGQAIHPLILDQGYTIDIDMLQEWDYAEWLVSRLELPIVRPQKVSHRAPTFLAEINLLVLDFDGVLTDNRVLVDETGREAVWCHRGDGLGVARLKEAGIEVFVLSSETNPVVEARCRKLKIEHIQGSDDKLAALQKLAEERVLQPERIAYVGNDVNDLPCMDWVGTPIAVADAMPEVVASAKWVTRKRGGEGAVREVAELLLENRQSDERN
jgi:N-acylneuraminate cytidylyltransferase